MIEDLVDSVRQRFRQNGCPAPVATGAQFVAEHDAPPRVVFVPDDDTFLPALPAQTRPGVGARQPYEEPRQIWRRMCGCTIHIWAAGVQQSDLTKQYRADCAALGALINQTILAIHQANPGNYELLGGQTNQQTKQMRNGLLYVLRARIAVPVIDIEWIPDAPYGAQAEAKTGNTWINESGVVAQISESFGPGNGPAVVIPP